MIIRPISHVKNLLAFRYLLYYYKNNDKISMENGERSRSIMSLRDQIGYGENIMWSGKKSSEGVGAGVCFQPHAAVCVNLAFV